VALAQGLEIIANVPEVDIGQIYPEQFVDVYADSYPDRPFRGQVRLIAPEAIRDQNVTSFEVKIGLLTGQDLLRSGMNVDVTFIAGNLNNAMVVPTVAVVTLDGEAGLLVLNQEQKPVFRPVTVGSIVGEQTQILDGIEVGELVFVDLPKGIEFEDIEPEEN
jgi:HlyD family secretion protein